MIKITCFLKIAQLEERKWEKIQKRQNFKINREEKKKNKNEREVEFCPVVFAFSYILFAE